MNQAHPICHIVPPRVLQRIATEHPDPAIRANAIRTLAIDHSIRTVRVQNAGLVGAMAQRASLFAKAPGKPDRRILDAGGGDDPRAAREVRREDDPPVQDTAANEVYDHFGSTYDLYWKVFQRNSIDGRGMGLKGIVHYGHDFNNAFWDGQQMIFGDGDGQTLTHFTGAVDVIGHELTHGVTQMTCGLQYVGQSGALNESISDVFGSLVKQYTLGQTADQADWLIGEGVLGPALPGKALRSMAAPGTAFEYDDQPATMDAYVYTGEDNGGVHTNSGIPNHAFYLVATAIGGNAWEKAGRIWYDAIRDPRVQPNAQFQDFAAVTLQIARRLFGDGAESQAVGDAWTAVGVAV